MSIEQINPRDVEWPDEREPYVPRHRSSVGRTHPLSMIGSVWRVVGIHERGTGRQTMDSWKARQSLRHLLNVGERLNEAVAR
jgi:hypothetical protein